MITPAVSFAHLVTLTDDVGLFEHAEFTTPRLEHGYCVDDVARGLVVVAREPEPTSSVDDLAAVYLQFLVAAQVPDGRFHNRRAPDGSWADEPNLEDCWGRALWGLGTAVARSGGGGRGEGSEERAGATMSAPARTALARFELGATRRSPHLRAMAFAALGAAEVLSRFPGHPAARALLADSAALICSSPAPGAAGPAHGSTPWPWPEPRLAYANAVLPEVLLAAGAALDQPQWSARGLELLGWLLDTETREDHISVTPVGGWVTGEARPGFDQQPIEVAALADACARAYDLTADPRWKEGLLRCQAWFLGANDARTALIDVLSGGGCDGLLAAGRNENQGAESTLAMISVFQRTRRLLVRPR